MANSKSIEHVQDAESKAKSIVEEADKEKSEKLAKAQEKGAKVLAEAEAKAKEMKAEMIRKAQDEIAKAREKGLSDAKEFAKRIEKTKVSKDKIKRISNRAAKEITG